MALIPTDYYTKNVKVEITQSEIQAIIEELERVPHNIFTFMNYAKLIKKLKRDWSSFKPGKNE